MVKVVSKDIYTIGNITEGVRRILTDVTAKGMVITEEMYRGKGNFIPFYKMLINLKKEVDHLSDTLDIRQHSQIIEKTVISSDDVSLSKKKINETLYIAICETRKMTDMVRVLNSDIASNTQGDINHYKKVYSEVIRLKILIDSYIEAVRLTYAQINKDTKRSKTERRKREIKEFFTQLRR